MSAAAESESDTMQCCASCGTAEIDDIKLKRCNGCHLVKYCSVECQKAHRSKHKKECKKRAAELKDEILFKQPESSHLGDCPICCLPLPIDIKKSSMYSCCGKHMCTGCSYANLKREREEGLQRKCPFCRTPLPKSEEEFIEQLLKRVEANDPVAMQEMGTERRKKGDYNSAFEYWTRAAALGDVQAHYNLSLLYANGQGVEKDEKKQLHHLKEAAIGGHPTARNNLGCVEEDNGRLDRAAKHWIIGAKLGYGNSLDPLKTLYRAGLVSKEDFNAALRGYQAAIDATKSPQREEAKLNAPNRVFF